MCPREALYGLAKVDEFGGRAATRCELNAWNGICEKSGYSEVVWMEIAVENCFYIPARERCGEQLRGS